MELFADVVWFMNMLAVIGFISNVIEAVIYFIAAQSEWSSSRASELGSSSVVKLISAFVYFIWLVCFWSYPGLLRAEENCACNHPVVQE